MTRPDPARPRDKAPVCDTGKGSVALDWTMTGILGTTTVALLGSSSSDSRGVAVVPAIFGAIYLASAAHGNSVANECRKAMADFAAAPPVEPEPPRVARRKTKPAETMAAAPTPMPVLPAPKPSEPEAGSRKSEAGEVGPWADFWKEIP